MKPVLMTTSSILLIIVMSSPVLAEQTEEVRIISSSSGSQNTAMLRTNQSVTIGGSKLDKRERYLRKNGVRIISKGKPGEEDLRVRGEKEANEAVHNCTPER